MRNCFWEGPTDELSGNPPRHTSCPAVLTENLFMDNLADCDFLLSEEGQQALVDLHVDGIISYLESI